MVAATQQITARGGAVIGNSFKTIFTRLQRPKVLDALADLGVATKDSEGNVLGLMGVLGNLAQTYDQLAPRQQSMVSEMVGGVFQINILKAALGDLGKEFSLYAAGVKIANSATNEAEMRNKEFNQTIGSQLIQTLNNLTKAGAKVGAITFGPVLKDSLGGINKLLSGFGGDSEKEGSTMGEKIATGILSGIGSLLKGPGVALLTLGIFKMFDRLSKFGADALGSLLGFNQESKNIAAIQQQITSYLEKNPAILASITSGLKTEKEVHRDILNIIDSKNIAMMEMDKLAGSIATKMGKTGFSYAKEGPLKDTIVGPGTKGKAQGYIPNFNQANFEERNARDLGATRSVMAKFYPNVKADGRKGVLANNEETIISPKEFKNKFGITPKNNESAIMPRYGPVGQERERELKNKIKKAQRPLNFSEGFVPNFVTRQDVEELRNLPTEGRKYGPKAGATQAQDSKPSIANVLDHTRKNVNQITLEEMKEYVDLYKEGLIRGNFHKQSEKAPSEATAKAFYILSGGALGTSEEGGRSKIESAKIPYLPEEKMLPILLLKKQDKEGRTSFFKKKALAFNLSIPHLEENFLKVLPIEYEKMVKNMGDYVFDGLEDKQTLQKAFKPVKLARDSGGLIKGIVWESFVRGMIEEQEQEAGQKIDIQETPKIHEPFKKFFPATLQKNPFEIRSTDIRATKVQSKLERGGGISQENALGDVSGLGHFLTTGEMPVANVPQIDNSGETTRVWEDNNGRFIPQRFRPKASSTLGRPRETSFASAIQQSSEIANKDDSKKAVGRMVLDLDYLRNFYKSLPEDQQESLFESQGVENTQALFNKIAVTAQNQGKETVLINGAAGSGKTTLALGSKGKQVSSLGDLNQGNKLVIIRAAEQAERLVKEDYFSGLSKVINLDVPKEEIERRRLERDASINAGNAKTAFGRKAGSTKYAESDFGPAEARLAEEFQYFDEEGNRRHKEGKFKALRAKADETGKWKWHSKDSKEIEKIHDVAGSATVGAFAPPTVGHGRLYKEIQKDVLNKEMTGIVYVSEGKNRENDVGLSIKEKENLIKAQYGDDINTVSVSGSSIPEVSRIKGKLTRMVPGKSNVYLSSDRIINPATGKADPVGAKFKKAGFNVTGLDRDLSNSDMSVENMTATKVRKALLDGEMEDLRTMLEPKIFDILTKPENMEKMKERGALIKLQKTALEEVDAKTSEEFKKLTAIALKKNLRQEAQGVMKTLAGKITESEDPEVVAIIKEITRLRNEETGIINKKYGEELRALQHNSPIAFSKGFIPNFAPTEVSRALKTENEMGGKGVLDFQQGLGLYVRDRNTQPNFAAVMRDHPEGLNAAIQNSAVSQGMASRGFIPNFTKKQSKGFVPNFDEFQTVKDLLPSLHMIAGHEARLNESKTIEMVMANLVTDSKRTELEKLGITKVYGLINSEVDTSGLSPQHFYENPVTGKTHYSVDLNRGAEVATNDLKRSRLLEIQNLSLNETLQYRLRFSEKNSPESLSEDFLNQASDYTLTKVEHDPKARATINTIYDKYPGVILEGSGAESLAFRTQENVILKVPYIQDPRHASSSMSRNQRKMSLFKKFDWEGAQEDLAGTNLVLPKVSVSEDDSHYSQPFGGSILPRVITAESIGPGDEGLPPLNPYDMNQSIMGLIGETFNDTKKSKPNRPINEMQLDAGSAANFTFIDPRPNFENNILKADRKTPDEIFKKNNFGLIDVGISERHRKLDPLPNSSAKGFVPNFATLGPSYYDQKKIPQKRPPFKEAEGHSEGILDLYELWLAAKNKNFEFNKKGKLTALYEGVNPNSESAKDLKKRFEQWKI
ncbi:MAG: phage tail tape measure protein, partial [Candidatus Staskawiczbacteria bacterium]|nr:phage tail tape measure protein [Candidatus Staskawiczbacteria bacterium]